MLKGLLVPSLAPELSFKIVKKLNNFPEAKVSSFVKNTKAFTSESFESWLNIFSVVLLID